MVLERQLAGKKVRFIPAVRAVLAALVYRLRRQALGRVRLLVRPIRASQRQAAAFTATADQ